MRRNLVLLVCVAAGFVLLQVLRWPEPTGFDQSLFGAYGHWIGRGLALYRDLWDSKPPGIFLAYAVGERLAGTAHAPRLLDAVASAAAGVLAYLVLRGAGGLGEGERSGPADALARRVAPWAGAVVAAFVASEPVFAGPRVAGQSEVLLGPLLLGAALAARRTGARWAAVAGALVGGAVCLKIVALFFLPVPWVFASRASRRRGAWIVAMLAGVAAPILACALWLASAGALAEALRAVILFPRAYATEIAGRMPLLPALSRGASGLGRGLPLVWMLAAVGAAASPRAALVIPALAWLVLAALGAAAQRQIVDYQLFVLTTPLALLAGQGAGVLAGWMARCGRDTVSRRARAALAGIVLLVALPLALELRAWRAQYAPHLALRAGRLAREEFVLRFGRPGLAWLEAEEMGAAIARWRTGAGGAGALLVWGLAPALYAVSGCPPATRYAFHQTLLVEDSPLSRRWPDAAARREELLRRMRSDPPRFVVVASGDRSGLEPHDSESELGDFPALQEIFERDYRQEAATRFYRLLVRAGS